MFSVQVVPYLLHRMRWYVIIFYCNQKSTHAFCVYIMRNNCVCVLLSNQWHNICRLPLGEYCFNQFWYLNDSLKPLPTLVCSAPVCRVPFVPHMQILYTVSTPLKLVLDTLNGLFYVKYYHVKSSYNYQHEFIQEALLETNAQQVRNHSNCKLQKDPDNKDTVCTVSH